MSDKLSDRELSERVAAEVMSHIAHCDNGEGFCENCGFEMLEWQIMRWRQHGGVKPTETPCVPDYAEKIEFAMLVVEKMRERFSNIGIGAANGWTVNFWDIDQNGNALNTVSWSDPSLTRAICLAAIEATKNRES